MQLGDILLYRKVDPAAKQVLSMTQLRPGTVEYQKETSVPCLCVNLKTTRGQLHNVIEGKFEVGFFTVRDNGAAGAGKPRVGRDFEAPFAALRIGLRVGSVPKHQQEPG
jgi:hypothetical protein